MIKLKKGPPKPRWLKKSLFTTPGYEQTRSLIRKRGLHTVCQEARCPNLWGCFSRRTATFMIMGNHCTRNCRFCAVETGRPARLDMDEAERVAVAVKEMQLRYVVITSVTRDDLPDGGASSFAHTIKAVKSLVPGVNVEVLVPDFQGNPEALATVIEAGPVVLNHNMETVSRLYPSVRPAAAYGRSLELLGRVAGLNETIPAKTGIMLGLGEKENELEEALRDTFEAGARILTLGQYLQPKPGKHPVARYVPPEEFDEWKVKALSMGFLAVASGPYVRSSYEASGLYNIYLDKPISNRRRFARNDQEHEVTN